MMNDLVSAILEKPNAKIIVEKVNRELEAELTKRQAFYEMIDQDTKAEFVNGEVLFHSPVKKRHNDAAGHLYNLLKPFSSLMKLGYVGFDKILVSLTRNDYEPDVCFFRQEKAKDFKADQMIFPIPDLAVEVLSSNEQHDRVTKFEDYQEHGVQEYWIIDPAAKSVEQYILKEGKFELILKSTEGHIECRVVEGFRIPISAIFDETANLEALMQLLQE
ncbi:MAG: Uma2 family endonuclease [Bacteroidota bacterium]